MTLKGYKLNVQLDEVENDFRKGEWPNNYVCVHVSCASGGMGGCNANLALQNYSN